MTPGNNRQRGRRVRQYLPRTTDMTTVSQDQLDAIAAELNSRPRQTLGFKAPSEALAEQLQ
jgi:IS30 family transposase